MMFDNAPTPRPQQVKKFYFLDYIFILLESCSNVEAKVLVFSNFRALKDQARLGESKYRKLLSEHETKKLSERQVQRYRYTFDQVILEAANYGLIVSQKERVSLTKTGEKCLEIGRKNRREFYNELLKVMESNYFAFYHIVNFCYEQNSSKNGLLIFPIYSPRKLGMEKSNMKKHKDWLNYIDKLRIKLEKDVLNYIEKRIDLKEANNVLVDKLIEDRILSRKGEKEFDPAKYNAIIGRIRKYWLNYFLKDIYNYNFSFDTFNLWVERGKQFGILHSSEIYPEFDGRLVFPTSVIIEKNNNPDLKELYRYDHEVKYPISTIHPKVL